MYVLCKQLIKADKMYRRINGQSVCGGEEDATKYMGCGAKAKLESFLPSAQRKGDNRGKQKFWQELKLRRNLKLMAFKKDELICTLSEITAQWQHCSNATKSSGSLHLFRYSPICGVEAKSMERLKRISLLM